MWELFQYQIHNNSHILDLFNFDIAQSVHRYVWIMNDEVDRWIGIACAKHWRLFHFEWIKFWNVEFGIFYKWTGLQCQLSHHQTETETASTNKNCLPSRCRSNRVNVCGMHVSSAGLHFGIFDALWTTENRKQYFSLVKLISIISCWFENSL